MRLLRGYACLIFRHNHGVLSVVGEGDLTFHNFDICVVNVIHLETTSDIDLTPENSICMPQNYIVRLLSQK